MKAEDKQAIEQEVLKRFPGTDPEMDIDWEMMDIAFKEGHRNGLSLERQGEAYLSGVDVGRKEVVDWGLSNCGNPEHPLPWLPKHQCPMCWHNQKEDWGIK